MNHAGKQTLTALSFSLWLNCTPSFSIHHQQHFCHPSYALLCNRKIFQKVYIKHGCFSIHTESTRWIYITKVHITNNFPEDIVSFRIHIQTYEKCKILKANLYLLQFYSAGVVCLIQQLAQWRLYVSQCFSRQCVEFLPCTKVIDGHMMDFLIEQGSANYLNKKKLELLT